MLYNTLKILHIISAACVLTSMAYSFYLWRFMLRNGRDTAAQIQSQTSLIIIPFAILQLASGFTLISLEQSGFSEFWVAGSMISFILVILSWFGFIYFLSLSQQAAIMPNKIKREFYQQWQTIMLLISALGLLCMLFFMANKAAFSSGSLGTYETHHRSH